MTIQKKGEKELHCYRCGCSRKDARKYKIGCMVWGTYFGRHFWEKKCKCKTIKIINPNSNDK